MATIKTTLIKKMDDETNNIYPKTSADVVEYGDTTVSAVLDAVVNSEDLEASEQRIYRRFIRRCSKNRGSWNC